MLESRGIVGWNSSDKARSTPFGEEGRLVEGRGEEDMRAPVLLPHSHPLKACRCCTLAELTWKLEEMEDSAKEESGLKGQRIDSALFRLKGQEEEMLLLEPSANGP